MSKPVHYTKKYIASKHQFSTVGSNDLLIPTILGQSNVTVMTIVNGNVGIGITNPSQKLDVAGTLQTSNLRVLGTVEYTAPQNTNLQVSPLRKVFYVESASQSLFEMTTAGVYGGQASNAQVFVGQNLLKYYSETVKDYSLNVTYNTTNTIYTVTLQDAVDYGSLVDITIWPTILPTSVKAGSLYQSVNVSSQWQSGTGSDIYYYTTGNVGIGTTAQRQLLDVQGGSAIISGTVGIGTTRTLNALEIYNGAVNVTRNGPCIKLESFNVGGYVEQYFTVNGISGNFEFGSPFGATQNTFAYVNRTSGTATEASSFFIAPNGNVGIGTRSPTGILGLGVNGAAFPLPSGNAPLFGCRAWVSFRYSSGVVIQGSGNVSSVTRNNTGDYTINFATAMPTSTYAVAMAWATGNGRFTWLYNGTFNTTADPTRTTGGFRIYYADTGATAAPVAADPACITAMVIC